MIASGRVVVGAVSAEGSVIWTCLNQGSRLVSMKPRVVSEIMLKSIRGNMRQYAVLVL